MPGIRVCLLLAVVLVLPDCALAQQAMQQPPRCRTAIPDNIDAGVFTADMLALLRWAP